MKKEGALLTRSGRNEKFSRKGGEQGGGSYNLLGTKERGKGKGVKRGKELSYLSKKEKYSGEIRKLILISGEERRGGR